MERVQLGRTDLQVSRFGIGGGGGIRSADLRYAISKGINYIFTSCDLHSYAYSRSYAAIRDFCRSGKRKREQIVLAACSYLNDPEKLAAILIDQVSALRCDYVDVFFWGWVPTWMPPRTLLSATDAALRSDAMRAHVDELLKLHGEVERELRARGYARYLGISTHDRALARALLNEPLLDVLMIRYNPAHRGAESEIFPYAGAQRPGIVLFNATHGAGGSLAGEGAARPSFGDLYRYALSAPCADTVLTGVRSRAEIDDLVLTASKGALSPDEIAALNRYGEQRSSA